MFFFFFGGGGQQKAPCIRDPAPGLGGGPTGPRLLCLLGPHAPLRGRLLQGSPPTGRRTWPFVTSCQRIQKIKFISPITAGSAPLCPSALFKLEIPADIVKAFMARNKSRPPLAPGPPPLHADFPAPVGTSQPVNKDANEPPRPPAQGSPARLLTRGITGHGGFRRVALLLAPD